MTNVHLGYITELQAQQFTENEDGTAVSTFQAFPYGTYHHPLYGKIDYDKTKATQMADNVVQNVRGQELDIDYNHKSHGPEAAGWIKAAEARDDALWLTVEWTKTAYQKIKEKAFKYFSPEFDWKWKHPQTQQVHENVLFGGGITNRPFLKGILPINLSEFVGDDDIDDNHQEETGMDPKLLRKLLGLPEDATDEQVTEAANKLPADAVIQAPEPPKEEPKEDEPPGNGGIVDRDNEGEPLAASDPQIQEVIRLAEASTDPLTKALGAAVAGLHKTVQVQGSALALSEARETVLKLSQPTEGKMLSAGAGTLLQDALLNPTRENLMKFAEGVVKGGVVPAGESAQDQHQGGDGADPIKKFHDAVETTAEKRKVSFNEAAEIVASEQPAVFEAYRAASYSFVENRT